MIQFKYMRFLTEGYADRLKQKGVSGETLRYLESLKPSDKGKAIAMLMSNPKLEIDDLKGEDIRVDNRRVHGAILAADPSTTNIQSKDFPPPGDYYRIIKQWWLDRSIRLPEDEERILEVLEYYNKYKNRFKTKYISKYKEFQDLEQEFLEVSGLKSKRQEVRDMKMQGAKKLYDDSYWSVYEITSKEAACYYGKGTRWCTAADRNNQADRYLRDGPLYIYIDKKNHEKYQSTHNLNQFLDSADKRIDFSQIPELVELIEHLFLDTIASDPETAYNYAENIAQGEVSPKIEDVIAKDGYHSYHYARLIEKRFEKGEDAIAKNSADSYGYAMWVLQSRFPKGEKIIGESHGLAFKYAKNILDDRFPEGEDIIAKDADDSLYYAIDIIKGRFEKGEDIIARDPYMSLQYAKQALKGRFKKGEYGIIKNVQYVFTYALSVMKGPWPEAEPILAQNPNDALQYAKEVLKGRFIRFEEEYKEKKLDYGEGDEFNNMMSDYNRMALDEYNKLYGTNL